MEQTITPVNVVLTPQAKELTDPNDRPHCLMQIFQQRNTHNPNTYTKCRLSPLDYPPQRFVGDHQLMNQQNDAVQNEVYLPSNNTSSPFQPWNQNLMSVQQQNQSKMI